ncbi:Crp/Fnr family transcriptional regulator [Cytophagaceae bacterium ABcell3]|nr:Crp/Fnr family transcriptional regulator [Cytophagaceae bacterium ABcell3]
MNRTLLLLMQASLPIQSKYLNFLGPEEKELLFAQAAQLHAKKGDAIIVPGKPVKDVFYIQKGIVRLYMTDEGGREINTHLAWEGMFITSLYSLINNKPSDESLMAVTDCELLHFPYSFISSMFDRYPKVERLAKMLVEEAFSCQFERIRMMQAMTAKKRYSHLMESMPNEVFLKVPMQDIASYLGIAPGSLSRIRNEFS